ncbi:hypothetical protein NDU88_010521 [Pleurodeles waltl]|uniref:Myb/SANT-like DNA-binding domain-containing protein n=1 Tax=Pleurodeles waltl TaxID=8319 RepID=A0AAV7QYI3_PLEWA|nr:hypothetical protein NDU88_010521 [Pleurodeles waltl]
MAPQRHPRISEEELRVMVEEIIRVEPQLFGSQVQHTSIARKMELLRRIVDRDNAVGQHPRTRDDIRKRWNDLRGKVRSVVSRHHIAVQRTGGGSPPPPPQLTTWEEQVLATLHPEGLAGVAGGMDSGPPAVCTPEAAAISSHAPADGAYGGEQRAESQPTLSTEELEKLVDGLLPQYTLLYSPPDKQASAHQKKDIWRAITKEVRTLGVYHRRSTHCRKRWEDIRRWSKKTAEAQLGMASQRGRGARRTMTPLMFRILAVAYPELDGRLKASQQPQGVQPSILATTSAGLVVPVVTGFWSAPGSRAASVARSQSTDSPPPVKHKKLSSARRERGKKSATKAAPRGTVGSVETAATPSKVGKGHSKTGKSGKSSTVDKSASSTAAQDKTATSPAAQDPAASSTAAQDKTAASPAAQGKTAASSPTAQDKTATSPATQDKTAASSTAAQDKTAASSTAAQDKTATSLLPRIRPPPAAPLPRTSPPAPPQDSERQ